MLYEPTAETDFEIENFNNGTVTTRNANALNLADSKLIVAAYDNEDNLLGAVANKIDANLASGESTLQVLPHRPVLHTTSSLLGIT